MRRRYSLKDCALVSLNSGGKCISSEYKNTKVKMLWECKYGHQWVTSFGKIKRGTWCPYCAKCKKKTIVDCQELAKIKNGICVSNNYKNAHTNMMWGCEDHHMWCATYANIYSGKWCPECAGLKKHNLKDCAELTRKYDGKCLSDRYISAKTIMLWRCKNNHEWKSTYNNIQRGQWCPECVKYKTQNILLQIIKEIFPNFAIKSNFRGIGWLKGKSEKRLEIDIFVVGLKLAIEYDGKQHFKPIRFGGISAERAIENFKRRRQLDNIKNKKIKEHIEDIRYFIRFNYKEKMTKEYVIEKLKQNNIPIGEEDDISAI